MIGTPLRETCGSRLEHYILTPDTGERHRRGGNGGNTDQIDTRRRPTPADASHPGAKRNHAKLPTIGGATGASPGQTTPTADPTTTASPGDRRRPGTPWPGTPDRRNGSGGGPSQAGGGSADWRTRLVGHGRSRNRSYPATGPLVIHQCGGGLDDWLTPTLEALRRAGTTRTAAPRAEPSNGGTANRSRAGRPGAPPTPPHRTGARRARRVTDRLGPTAGQRPNSRGRSPGPPGHPTTPRVTQVDKETASDSTPGASERIPGIAHHDPGKLVQSPRPEPQGSADLYSGSPGLDGVTNAAAESDKENNSSGTRPTAKTKLHRQHQRATPDPNRANTPARDLRGSSTTPAPLKTRGGGAATRQTRHHTTARPGPLHTHPRYDDTQQREEHRRRTTANTAATERHRASWAGQGGLPHYPIFSWTPATRGFRRHRQPARPGAATAPDGGQTAPREPEKTTEVAPHDPWKPEQSPAPERLGPASPYSEIPGPDGVTQATAERDQENDSPETGTTTETGPHQQHQRAAPDPNRASNSTSDPRDSATAPGPPEARGGRAATLRTRHHTANTAAEKYPGHHQERPGRSARRRGPPHYPIPLRAPATCRYRQRQPTRADAATASDGSGPTPREENEFARHDPWKPERSPHLEQQWSASPCSETPGPDGVPEATADGDKETELHRQHQRAPPGPNRANHSSGDLGDSAATTEPRGTRGDGAETQQTRHYAATGPESPLTHQQDDNKHPPDTHGRTAANTAAGRRGPGEPVVHGKGLPPYLIFTWVPATRAYQQRQPARPDAANTADGSRPTPREGKGIYEIARHDPWKPERSPHPEQQWSAGPYSETPGPDGVTKVTADGDKETELHRQHQRAPPEPNRAGYATWDLWDGAATTEPLGTRGGKAETRRTRHHTTTGPEPPHTHPQYHNTHPPDIHRRQTTADTSAGRRWPGEIEGDHVVVARPHYLIFIWVPAARGYRRRRQTTLTEAATASDRGRPTHRPGRHDPGPARPPGRRSKPGGAPTTRETLGTKAGQPAGPRTPETDISGLPHRPTETPDLPRSHPTTPGGPGRRPRNGTGPTDPESTGPSKGGDADTTASHGHRGRNDRDAPHRTRHDHIDEDPHAMDNGRSGEDTASTGTSPSRRATAPSENTKRGRTGSTDTPPPLGLLHTHRSLHPGQLRCPYGRPISSAPVDTSRNYVNPSKQTTVSDRTRSLTRQSWSLKVTPKPDIKGDATGGLLSL